MIAILLSGYFQWFFRMSVLLFLGVPWGTLVWVGCFYKVLYHRVSSCIQVVLLCLCFPEDMLLFRSGSILGHFLVAISYFYLSLQLYYDLPLFNLCVQVWDFYYFGTVYVDLVVMLLSINLPYIILLLVHVTVLREM